MRRQPRVSRNGSRRSRRQPVTTSKPSSSAASRRGMSAGSFCRSPSMVTMIVALRMLEPGGQRRGLAVVAAQAHDPEARVVAARGREQPRRSRRAAVVDAARPRLVSVEPSSAARSSACRASTFAPRCRPERRPRAAACTQTSNAGQAHELPVAALDLVPRERAQALEAEVLDDERRHHAAVHDGAAQPRRREVARARRASP